MTLKLFFRSLVHVRNLGLLAVVLILFAFTGWMPLFFVGLLAFFFLVLEKARNADFQQTCFKNERIKRLRKLNSGCLSLYCQIKKKVAKNFTTKVIDKVSSILGKNNPTDLEARVNKVANMKDEIINAFFQEDYTNIKEKITSKSVELAVIYFKLMDSYASRLSDVSYSSLSNIETKIESNRHKLSISSNSHFADDLKLAIETDEKLLQRLKEEKEAVEKMGTKLNVIESTMLLLKQQIHAETQSDEIICGIEKTVNEANALDSALHQHIKTKKRI